MTARPIIDVLGLFLDMLSMGVYTTRHWQTSGRLVQELNIFTVGDRRMRALIFVYIIEKVAHAHAQNALLEWFWSTSGLGVVSRLLGEICWLRIR